MNFAFKAALVTAGTRLGLGFVLALWSRVNPEVNMLLLLDLPSVALYFLINKLGGQLGVVNAADPLFLCVGTVTWFFLGYALGLFLWHKKCLPKKLGKLS